MVLKHLLSLLHEVDAGVACGRRIFSPLFDHLAATSEAQLLRTLLQPPDE